MANELIRITGIEECCRAIKDAPREMVKLGFAKALRDAGKVLEVAIQAKTPIRLQVSGTSMYVDGGALRDAIRTDVTIDSQWRGGIASVNFGNQSYIANFVEYGHRMVTHDDVNNKALRSAERLKPKGDRRKIARIKGKEVGMVPAYPFLRPAFDAVALEAVDVFAKTLFSEIWKAETVFSEIKNNA